MKQLLINWLPAPQKPVLAANEIHIWAADLNLSQTEIDALLHYLSSDERERAIRFVREVDRNHFIAARGILRDILSRYQSIHPTELKFSYSSKGKPELMTQNHGENLYFNLSHSHGIALYAFTLIDHIGVDVECLQKHLAGVDIAERFFASEEVSQLQSLPTAEQLQGFYNIWTRKEAFIKALGAGLSYPLDQFVVNVNNISAQLLKLRENPGAVNEWSLFSFEVAPNYTAAVAIKNKEAVLQKWRWNND